MNTSKTETTETKVTVKPETELTPLEQDIIIRSEFLNLPALAAHFQMSEAEIIMALAKQNK